MQHRLEQQSAASCQLRACKHNFVEAMKYGNNRGMERAPAKPKRFMTPWKPLPMVVPTTSTNWPGTKCAAVMLVPIGSSASCVPSKGASAGGTLHQLVESRVIASRVMGRIVSRNAGTYAAAPGTLETRPHGA